MFENACKVFDNDVVHIGITKNPDKKDMNAHVIKWQTNPAFPYFDSANVKIVDKPLLVDYAGDNGYKCLVRSFRNSIDLVQEESLATWNKSLSGIPTVFVPLDKCLDHVSSSAVRSIDALGQNMSDYLVNEFQYERWKTKKPRRVIVTGRIGSGKSSFLDDFEDSFTVKVKGNTGERHRNLEIVDMDQVVKQRISPESAEVFKNFFEQTDRDVILAHWVSRPILDAPKDEVVRIIDDELDWRYTRGVYEISAFANYDLEHYYSDSIIVYVQNYDNGKDREIDHEFMLKALNMHQTPKVIDFVVDLAKDGRDGVRQIVEQINRTLEGNDGA